MWNRNKNILFVHTIEVSGTTMTFIYKKNKNRNIYFCGTKNLTGLERHKGEYRLTSVIYSIDVCVLSGVSGGKPVTEAFPVPDSLRRECVQ